MGTRGLVALGDSITRGRGMVGSLGVDPLSWAQWLAEALDLPYRCVAVDGAEAGNLVRDQLPRVGPGHDLATLYIGINDARSIGFDAAAFERDVGVAVGHLARCAERVLVMTIPLDLGRPRAGDDVIAANRILRSAAASAGATVCDLDDFTGWTHVLPDAVHPTAVGQLAIADRAARALGADVLPSSLVAVDRSPSTMARYGGWYARRIADDLVRRVVERRRYRHLL